jgi:hypothetical protein
MPDQLLNEARPLVNNPDLLRGTAGKVSDRRYAAPEHETTIRNVNGLSGAPESDDKQSGQ